MVYSVLIDALHSCRSLFHRLLCPLVFVQGSVGDYIYWKIVNYLCMQKLESRDPDVLELYPLVFVQLQFFAIPSHLIGLFVRHILPNQSSLM